MIDRTLVKYQTQRMKENWSMSDISNPINFTHGNVQPIIEFQDARTEWHDFHIIVTKERIVFGGACNVGFIESGYLVREDGESVDEGLNELLADLMVYYNDGPEYVSRIVTNERM
jgi:hypothetical protein